MSNLITIQILNGNIFGSLCQIVDLFTSWQKPLILGDLSDFREAMNGTCPGIEKKTVSWSLMESSKALYIQGGSLPVINGNYNLCKWPHRRFTGFTTAISWICLFKVCFLLLCTMGKSPLNAPPFGRIFFGTCSEHHGQANPSI